MWQSVKRNREGSQNEKKVVINSKKLKMIKWALLSVWILFQQFKMKPVEKNEDNGKHFFATWDASNFCHLPMHEVILENQVSVSVIHPNLLREIRNAEREVCSDQG